MRLAYAVLNILYHFAIELAQDLTELVSFQAVGLSVFDGFLDFVLATLQNWKCCFWILIGDVVEGGVETNEHILILLLKLIVNDCDGITSQILIIYLPLCFH